MAVFVDLDDECKPPNDPGHHHSHHHHHNHHGHHYGVKPEWNGERAKQLASAPGTAVTDSKDTDDKPAAESSPPRENPNRNVMTEALGCYPVAMAVASELDLNSLDNLSRTCRQVRVALLQYRTAILANSLRCVNEYVTIDPEDTFRYRARAGNWYYMEDLSRGGEYSGKSGNCARDMVAQCRMCDRVVCRNCAIKPPAPKVLRDRHRRLCTACTKAPLGTLVKPALLPDTPADADVMKQAICTCESEGVWLCQPCGRSIRGSDYDYHSIWKWRNQYGEVIGGLGNGIGDGDRGVICGRDSECCNAKEREQETDCDAEDAREMENGTPSPPWATPSPEGSPGSTRTPSPQLGPGYARHEIEGIGGVVKTKRLRMVKVGACVPEWEEEKNKGEILAREVSGRSRSWCGWCSRVIPGKKDYEKTMANRSANVQGA